MYLPMLILILVVAFALILIVMVQNPKGGGLSSSFGGNVNTIGGVQNTNTFLDRATWVLAISLFSLILLSKFTIDKNSGSNVEDKVIEMNSELEGVSTPEPATTKTVESSTEKVEKPVTEEKK